MKKSSVFVTLFLVVALIFAVSCPDKNPSINVTADKPTQTINLQGESKDATFALKVALVNDTFNSETVKADADVKDWVKSITDTTTTPKAEVKSATVTKLNEKKDEATVTLVVTAKAVTTANMPVKVTFEIPESKETSGTVWTTSKKAIAEAKANDIAITVIDKAAVGATVDVSEAVFTDKTADAVGKTIKVTLDGGTFEKVDGISVTKPEGATENAVVFATPVIDTTNKNVATIKVTTTDAIDKTKDATGYKITIPASCITPDGAHITADVAKTFDIIISDAKQYISAPMVRGTVDISFTVGVEITNGYFIELSLNNAQFVKENLSKIKVTPPEGADATHILFSDFVQSIQGAPYLTSIKTTVTCTGGVALADGGVYTITIPADAVTPDTDDYEVPSEGFTVIKEIKVNNSAS